MVVNRNIVWPELWPSHYSCHYIWWVVPSSKHTCPPPLLTFYLQTLHPPIHLSSFPGRHIGWVIRTTTSKKLREFTPGAPFSSHTTCTSGKLIILQIGSLHTWMCKRSLSLNKLMDLHQVSSIEITWVCKLIMSEVQIIKYKIFPSY